MGCCRLYQLTKSNNMRLVYFIPRFFLCVEKRKTSIFWRQCCCLSYSPGLETLTSTYSRAETGSLNVFFRERLKEVSKSWFCCQGDDQQ